MQQKKLLKIVSVFILLFFIGCNNDQRIAPNSTKNEISIGETFKITVRENQSTGYEMCWINRRGATSISLVNKDYVYDGPKDCQGCGGKAVFTFKGVAEGKDTIKLANCPTAREQKSCDDFTEKDVNEIDTFFAVVRKKL